VYVHLVSQSALDTPLRFLSITGAFFTSYTTYQAATTILLFFERHLDTHFGFISWIILSYDVTTNDTHDSNGRSFYV
jgi:hypothetical protein